MSLIAIDERILLYARIMKIDSATGLFRRRRCQVASRRDADDIVVVVGHAVRVQMTWIWLNTSGLTLTHTHTLCYAKTAANDEIRWETRKR